MPTPWYSIKKSPAVAAASSGDNASPSRAEILIYADIGEDWWSESVTAQQFVKDLSEIDAEEIVVRINSLGGSVPDGLAIYNALRRHPATITTVNDGMAMSIASLILMAGDTVEMADNALLMIHAPWTYAYGNSADLRIAADQLDKWAQAMATSYATKTGKSINDVLAILTDGVDHYFTASEALAEGWIDKATEAAPASAMASMRVMASARFSPEHKTRAALARPAAAAAHHEEQHMPGNTPAAAPNTPATQPTEAEIRAQALAEDQARRAAIQASAAPFASNPVIRELADRLAGDVTVTAQDANKQILAELAKGAAPAGGGRVETTEDERDKQIAAKTDALMVRAGVAGADVKARVAQGNPWRADSLMDLARASLDRSGVSHRGMDKMQIVALSFTQSTSDFPILLENALNKTLQAAYAIQADTWRLFCKKGSVSDFRDNPIYRVGSLSNLDSKTELGEFKNKTIPDGEKGVLRIGTKGNIINISRELVVNDDMSAFLGLASQIGRAAKRTIEADVYAALALNGGLGPTLLDGKPLFDAAHGNIGAGAAISVASIDADRVLMASQKDVSGNDFLALSPAVLLVATALGGTARVINASEFDPDTANKLNRPNMVRNLFQSVVDTPRLSGTRRYVFADPETAPVLTVGFLDGVEEPYVESKDGFSVDGSQMKVRLDYGVAATDFRGAVTNAGA